MSTVYGFRYLGQDVQIYEPNVILNAEDISIGDFSRLDSFCKVEAGRGVTIGAGVHISSFVHLNVGGGELVIGDNAAITTGACIITGTNTMAGQAMSSAAPKEMQVIERGSFVIGEGAFVGAHAVVDRANVGRYAVIGAGAVVTRDIPDYAVAMGVPARIVGDRRDKKGWNKSITAAGFPDTLETLL